MKRDTEPKYRIELSFIHYGNKRRETAQFAWNSKQDGKPTSENAKRYRDQMNASIQKGGTNEHLRKQQSDYSRATITEQETGVEVAKYNPPMFQTID